MSIIRPSAEGVEESVWISITTASTVPPMVKSIWMNSTTALGFLSPYFSFSSFSFMDSPPVVVEWAFRSIY